MQNTDRSIENKSDTDISFVFFGSSPISVTSLNSLRDGGFMPQLVVTQPDKQQGRHLKLVPSPVKVWAIENKVQYLTPEDIKSLDFIDEIKKYDANVGILVSYGEMMSKELINIFPKGVMNLHPSLLPLLRGPSPIENTILNDLKGSAGVSIMLLDEDMDHGPILAQKRVDIKWVPTRSELYDLLAVEGGRLLAETLPKWIQNAITPTPQDHAKATYTRLIEKGDGKIDLSRDPYKNFLKIRAYEGWPGTYFFYKHKDREIRVKITEVDFEDGELKIKKVIPEGKKEMDYIDFLRGYGNQSSNI